MAEYSDMAEVPDMAGDPDCTVEVPGCIERVA